MAEVTLPAEPERKPEQLNALGLAGLAERHLKRMGHLASLHQQLRELKDQITAGEEPARAAVRELGEQVIHFHGRRPLNIYIPSGTIVRVTCETGYGPDSARVTHERLFSA